MSTVSQSDKCPVCGRPGLLMSSKEGTQWFAPRPGEITLTREEFRDAFAKACAMPENANKELDATLGLTIERILFESEESEKTMSQDVTNKSQEFVQCPTCAGLGSIKRYSSDYIRLTGKCPFDGTVLYDPATNPRPVFRECKKCGKMWLIERK